MSQLEINDSRNEHKQYIKVEAINVSEVYVKHSENYLPGIYLLKSYKNHLE